jgi:hypothetical protein
MPSTSRCSSTCKRLERSCPLKVQLLCLICSWASCATVRLHAFCISRCYLKSSVLMRGKLLAAEARVAACTVDLQCRSVQSWRQQQQQQLHRSRRSASAAQVWHLHPLTQPGHTQAGTHHSGKTELVSFTPAYADTRGPEGASLEDDLEELRELLGVAEADPPVGAQVDSDDAPDAESHQELQRLLAHLHDPVSAGSDYSVLQVWRSVWGGAQHCNQCAARIQ